MSLSVVLAMAIALIQSEERCHTHAYPDPLSELGKRIGPRGIDIIGNTGALPTHDSKGRPFAGLDQLSGDPWTIGWGTTGEGIVRGLVWTQKQCDQALIERTQLAHTLAAGMYPGLHLLRVSAQAAIVSLVYNRGQSLAKTDNRREMRELQALVRAQDYAGIAAALRSMKRLWTARGLIARREREAVMVERPQ